MAVGAPGTAAARVAAADRAVPIRHIERTALHAMIVREATIVEISGAGRLAVNGDQAALGRLLGLLDPPARDFPIVTPSATALGG